jgi:hypothetical protein
MRRQDPYADIALPVQTGDPYADIALPIPTNRNRRQAPSAPAPQDGEDAPFQPELLPGDNGVYPPPPLAGATPPPAPLDTISAEEAAANASAFGNQGTRLDPIDLQTLPPEDRAYLNAGMWVKLPNGEVRRMMRDARPGAGGAGTEQVRPGLFIEENADVGTDIAKSLPTGVVEGLTGMVGLPNAVMQGLGFQQGQYLPGYGMVGPTGQQMNQAIRNHIGYDYFQPQTPQGGYAKSVGENLIGGLAPGGPLTRIASVAVPAFASEGAGQIAEGMGASPTAQSIASTIAGLGGGLAVGGFNAARSGADISLRNAAQGVTPQQLQMAAALKDRAQAAGINMTMANAIQQVTGGATGLGQLQRAVEGNSLLQRYFAELPEQMRTAMMAQLDQIGPSVPPSTLAPRVQQASAGVLETLRRRANEDADPFYRNLPGQSLSDADYAVLAENPSFQRALGEVRGNPEIAPNLMAGGTAVPDNDLSVINAVVKRLRTLSEEAVPNSMRTGGDLETAAVRTNAANLADELARQASRDYGMARDTVRGVNEAFGDPLKAGVIGALADTSDVAPNLATMTGRIFPPKPFEGQADEAVQAFELMNLVDPTVGGPLVRQHLARQFMDSMKDKTGGPNQFGGADFAARMFGNEEQRRAVLGAIDVTAPPPSPLAFPPLNPNAPQARPSDPMAQLVEILQATGQRHQGGSQTAFIQELQRQMRGGDVVQESWASLLNPMRIPGRVAGAVDELTAQANKDTLANLLMGSSEEFNARLTRALNRPRGANRIRAGVAIGAGQED